ncbi:MAG: cytochrome c [Chloroflexi bacterium]|nr:cytochrome c [Chloroflexota bacterium]
MKSIPFLVPLLILLACGSPTPTPPPPGLEPTFVVGPTYAVQPTFAVTPPPDPGRLIFFSQGCAACHTIAGISDTTTDATISPDLTNIATVAATRKPPLAAEDYIRESIQSPEAFVVAGFKPLMPALAEGTTERELEDLVDFLLKQQ